MQRRPYIHLNFAITAEGSVTATDDGAPTISSQADWRRVHRLRERYDAVAIGARTWEQDQPRLTVRCERLGREPRRQPHRVIFGGSRPCAVVPDGRLTFWIGAAILGAGAAPAAAAPARAVDDTILIETHGHLLQDPLGSLYGHSIRSLLVEGGPVLLRSFVVQRCYDRLTVFVRTDLPEHAVVMVRKVLPDPPPLRASRFGQGVLLTWGAPLSRTPLLPEPGSAAGRGRRPKGPRGSSSRSGS